MIKNFKKTKLLLLPILLLINILFFSTTNPYRGSVFLIIVGFVLLGLTFYYINVLLLMGLSVYSPKLEMRASRLARLTALTAIILLAMQSIGQLSSRDILTAMPLVILGYWYLSLNRRQKV